VVFYTKLVKSHKCELPRSINKFYATDG